MVEEDIIKTAGTDLMVAFMVTGLLMEQVLSSSCHSIWERSKVYVYPAQSIAFIFLLSNNSPSRTNVSSSNRHKSCSSDVIVMKELMIQRMSVSPVSLANKTVQEDLRNKREKKILE